MDKKKILILGGANLHCKLVKAAKEMGLYTVVTDYLVDSPAKKLADESWMLNITDVDAIVDRCKQEGIGAVISTHLDPCQRPYQMICERLNIPCYIDTYEQVYALTDKDAFKNACIKSGVDIIPTYEKEIFLDESKEEKIEFPVLIKPAHSRGSRGQTICYSRGEVAKAIEVAEKESGNGRAIIEKYMGNKNDFTMTYIFADGEAYMTRIADRYLGASELGLEKVGIGVLSPSYFTELYVNNVQERVLNMLKNELKIKNGPVFMQGFVDGDTVRFYDPGYRFPGSEYDTMFEKVWDINLMKMMVEFAITGVMCTTYGTLNHQLYNLNGQAVIALFPTMRAGKIYDIQGLDEIANMPEVVCYTIRHNIGEVVSFSRDVNQRFGEFDIVGKNKEDLKNAIERVLNTLHVIDENGEDMLIGNLKISDIH